MTKYRLSVDSVNIIIAKINFRHFKRVTRPLYSAAASACKHLYPTLKKGCSTNSELDK